MESFQVLFKAQVANYDDYCLGFLWQAAPVCHFNIQQIFTGYLQMLSLVLSVTNIPENNKNRIPTLKEFTVQWY